MRHTVGGVDTFSRDKYISLHSTNHDRDWWGNNNQSLGQPNEIENLLEGFIQEYDVYFGRDTGQMRFQSMQAQQAAPGFPDTNVMASVGATQRQYPNFTTAQRAVIASADIEKRMATWVQSAQDSPLFPNGALTARGWAYSQTDTQAEPFGTASGVFSGHYLLSFFNQGNSFGQGGGAVKPAFFEVINEPVFNLIRQPPTGVPPTTYDKIFRYHKAMRDQVVAVNGAKPVAVGGYAPAFPDFEEPEIGETGVFGQWINRDRPWYTGLAQEMDFTTLHIYDADSRRVNGEFYRQLKRGSHLEAIFDIIDNSMAPANGKQLKPILITEYGTRVKTLSDGPWSPQRDWYSLKANNSQMMQYMERPDRIAKAIPFIPVKAEWGRVSATEPYNWRLMRQKFEDGTAANAGDGTWVFTELVKLYQLWEDVKGTRLDSWASDPDFMVDAYYSNDTRDLFVIVNSLETSDRMINTRLLGIPNGAAISQVEIKHLYGNAAGLPVLDVSTPSSLPAELSLGAEATVIMRLRLSSDVAQGHTLTQTRHYAVLPTSNSGLTPIAANTNYQFTISGVTPHSNGEAVLRLGFARDHLLSLQPVVTINGTALTVPSDYRGYDQYDGGKGKFRFFGVLEIPVPVSALQASNTVQVRFPDSGGAISSLVLHDFTATRSLSRR